MSARVYRVVRSDRSPDKWQVVEDLPNGLTDRSGLEYDTREQARAAAQARRDLDALGPSD